MSDIEPSIAGRGGEAQFSATEADTSAGVAHRRTAPRYAVDLEISLKSEHNFYAGFVENMSAGGLFIATHVVKPQGSLVDFTIAVPCCNEPVRGTGEVRWIREYSESSDAPPGIGIRFTELLGRSAQIIQSFLRTRDPMFWDD